jgi:hypothetical protein
VFSLNGWCATVILKWGLDAHVDALACRLISSQAMKAVNDVLQDPQRIELYRFVEGLGSLQSPCCPQRNGVQCMSFPPLWACLH